MQITERLYEFQKKSESFSPNRGSDLSLATKHLAESKVHRVCKSPYSKVDEASHLSDLLIAKVTLQPAR